LKKIPEKNRVYIDESGVDKYLQREYARAPRGVQIFGAISGKRYARESFIAAKVESSILAPFCYTRTCDTFLFNLWLKDFLIPVLKPGQVVIMDNASFHKSQDSQRLIEQAGCKVLFLPPYSPDLNPIEVFWANFKKIIQNNLRKFKTLAEVIDFSFATVEGRCMQKEI
jgi:transposase